MSDTSNDPAARRDFGEQYELAQAEAMLEIERAACGCDYGGTSWTTREEADDVARRLALGPGKRLLELGAGSGWPGLYWADTTGCDMALIDLPLAGLRIAARRIAADRPGGTCTVTVADGAALPFGDAGFDAVSHSDVLCCLEPKATVLGACRRVIRPGGRMVFTVISIAPALSPADHERAVVYGPPYVESPDDYPAMLCRTGWTVSDRADLSAAYGATMRRVLIEEERRATALSDLLGADAYADRMTRRRNALGLVETGCLRRDLYETTAA